MYGQGSFIHCFIGVLLSFLLFPSIVVFNFGDWFSYWFPKCYFFLVFSFVFVFCLRLFFLFCVWGLCHIIQSKIGWWDSRNLLHQGIVMPNMYLLFFFCFFFFLVISTRRVHYIHTNTCIHQLVHRSSSCYETELYIVKATINHVHALTISSNKVHNLLGGISHWCNTAIPWT